MSAAPVDLETLSTEQFRQFLAGFDHVCCDCDGVLWSGAAALAGAGAAVAALAAHKSLHFVSNNSTTSPHRYRELFASAGLHDGYERLLTPAWALCEFLRSREAPGPLYCVACEQTVRQLTEAGFQCITGPEQAVAELEEVARLSSAPPGVAAVVMDSDYAVNIHKLHRCISALEDPRVLFLCGAPDRHVPLAPGRKVMGAGVFSELVSAQARRAPLVFGKPARALGDMLLRRANITEPARVLFIGDSIEQDIRFARTMGFQSLLVLSGVTTRADLTRALASRSANVTSGDAASVDPTAASVKPTAASVDPTAASVDPTAASVDPTAASVDPTAASVKPTPDYYVTALGTLLDKLDACAEIQSS